jgi:carboxypeptidase D
MRNINPSPPITVSQAFVFYREFVLGSNATGLVDRASGSVTGGEDPALAVDVMPGGNVIYYGDGDADTTSLSTVAPSATLASWVQFIATATATTPSSESGPASNTSGPASSASGSGDPSKTRSGCMKMDRSMLGLFAVAVVVLSLLI